MKWILSFSYLLCAWGVFAAPWGALSDYEYTVPRRDAAKDEQPVLSRTPGERYLLKQVLEGRPIKAHIVPGDFVNGQESKYQKKIREAYNEWFSRTAKFIRSANREREFADILSILDKGISVEFVQSGQDISFEFVDISRMPDFCPVDSLACYERKAGQIPVIYVPYNLPGRSIKRPFAHTRGQLTKHTLVHEIGHSLGFSDQYALGRDNTHRIYRGSDPNHTIMNSSMSLTCDDADGMINLMDITLQTRRGGRAGWYSLCKKSPVRYSGGMQAGRGGYMIYSENSDWFVRTYREGTVQEETKFPMNLGSSLSPFESFPEKVSEQDDLGRPLRSVGIGGETVYYMYAYNFSIRLITKNGKVLMADTMTLDDSGRDDYRQQIFMFAVNGKPSTFFFEKNRSSGDIVYQEGDAGEFVMLAFQFIGDGIYSVRWEGSDVEGVTAPVRVSGRALAARLREGNRLRGEVAKKAGKRYNRSRKEQLLEKIHKWYVPRL